MIGKCVLHISLLSLPWRASEWSGLENGASPNGRFCSIPSPETDAFHISVQNWVSFFFGLSNNSFLIVKFHNVINQKLLRILASGQKYLYPIIFSSSFLTLFYSDSISVIIFISIESLLKFTLWYVISLPFVLSPHCTSIIVIIFQCNSVCSPALMLKKLMVPIESLS